MIIDSKKLLLILKILQPAVQQNAVLPILEYVKLEPGKIIATNLNLTIIHDLPECKETFVLPYNETLNICNVTDGDLTITATLILCGKDKFKLGVPQDVNQFPAIPVFDASLSLSVGSDFFYSLFNAEKCRLRNNTGEVKENICIDFKRGNIVGTDAQQLYKETVNITGDYQCLVDDNFVRAVALFTDADITANKKFFSASCAGVTAICTLSDGRYPDYSVVFPVDMPHVNLSVNKAALIAGLKKMQVYKTALPICIFDFTPGKISLSFNEMDFEQEATSEIECTHTVEIERISLNITLLLNLISCISGEVVNIVITDAHRAVYIIEGNKTLLLMPIASN